MVVVRVTPVETLAVAFALMAQIRKLYWVSWVKPVIAWLVPVMLPSLIVVPDAQSLGAVVPV